MTIALHQLAALGQTVWLDSISHDLIQSGALTVLISRGIRGGTLDLANYAPLIARRRGGPGATHGAGDAQAREEARLREDSRRAAEMLRAIYEQSRGQDGFAGVPVAGSLAHDPAGLVEEARRLYQDIARPNVMIEVPSTPAGIAALRQLIAEGISVQATLLFSLDAYKQVVDAYLDGLEDRAAAGHPLASVAAVAGFGIGPIDREVDRRLRNLRLTARDEAGCRAVDGLLGQAALANAWVAYQHFRQRFTSARFAALRAQGAQVQRLLWAGTELTPSGCGDTRYVDALIGPETIAALALPTLEAFEDHGRLRPMADHHLNDAYATLQALAEVGINLPEVADYLRAQGLRAAANPFGQRPPAAVFPQAALVGAGLAAPSGR
jgi:transaldolase/glucose-6-phosphate isomerase